MCPAEVLGQEAGIPTGKAMRRPGVEVGIAVRAGMAMMKMMLVIEPVELKPGIEDQANLTNALVPCRSERNE